MNIRYLLQVLKLFPISIFNVIIWFIDINDNPEEKQQDIPEMNMEKYYKQVPHLREQEVVAFDS